MCSTDANTLQVLLALIAAFGTAVASVVAAVAAYFAARAHSQALEAKGAVVEVHSVVNSRLDQLVETTRQLAHARGLAEGQAKETT